MYINANNLIIAKLVYDGADVSIPQEMGTPREDQMQGTPAEKLSEISGRVCYDSLGKGRPSFTTSNELPISINADGSFAESKIETVQGYHDHIQQVGHGSVLEHFNFTVGINRSEMSAHLGVIDEHLFAYLCMNRPGLVMFPSAGGVRLTLNLRSLLEWGRFTEELYVKTGDGLKEYATLNDQFYSAIANVASPLAPHVIPPCENRSNWESYLISPCGVGSNGLHLNDHEVWISMYMTGSRGLSHELVRHGDFTAISQRSTRFLDESEGDWVQHPLETAWREGDSNWITGSTPNQESRGVYRYLVGKLEPWLIGRGIDKLGARKQARGAARGYLGNALATSMIFSANVAQWKRMLRQRASVFADAEIRELFCKALPQLKSSRYGDRFENWDLQDSPDGIGQIALEKN